MKAMKYTLCSANKYNNNIISIMTQPAIYESYLMAMAKAVMAGMWRKWLAVSAVMAGIRLAM